MTTKKMELGRVVLLLHILVGLMFFVSGMSKVLHPYQFLASVYAYELLDANSGLLLASVLPWLELTIAVCLVLNVGVGGALILCLFLLSCFALAQGFALIRGLEISCACFSMTGRGDNVSLLTLARTVVFGALAGVFLFLAVRSGREQVADDHIPSEAEVSALPY